MPFRFSLKRPPAAAPDPIVDEAVNWLMAMQERPLNATEQQALLHWRQQSPQHEATWQAALRLKQLVGRIPADVGQQILGRERLDRRAVIKTLTTLGIALPLGAWSWRQGGLLSADHRTDVGQQQLLQLPDGSELRLNTATAVNVHFTADERRLELLRGEILLATVANKNTPTTPPLIVATEAGEIRALGTRFSVQDRGDTTVLVSVYQHAVAIRPQQASTEVRLAAGQAARFDHHRCSTPTPIARHSNAWARGQLISDNQRLADFVAELSRYRAGILRCDPAVAELRISGVFQLKDTDHILRVLTTTLPVRIIERTPYWLTISAV